MATLPASARTAVAEEQAQLALPTEEARVVPPLPALTGAALAVVGVLTVWPTALLLWALWTTDPLKSIGGFIPLVSLWLILRAWRGLGWETRGSWWGLAILAGTAATVALRDRAVLELVLGPGWSITLPPHSLVAVAYACGFVLLIGGRPLLRATWFPVLLMWFVNPVPNVFNRWVDLPLQHASAQVARALAHTLGQKLTPDQLYLMFTPDFGMFIAPGCDGIRGSITMGLIALVAGYLYRFRAKVWALTVAGAVPLGYLFNLLRLCVLVLYYVVALHWHALQGHAEMGDYCIGATLFFFATMLLFAAIRRFSPDGSLRVSPLGATGSTADGATATSKASWLRFAAFTCLVLICAVPYARGFLHTRTAATARVAFPANVGSYRLVKTWPEALATGQIIFLWAEYIIPNTGNAVQVGVSPVLGAHDTLLCHAARGEDWLWHGTLSLPTASAPVDFSGSLFNDGTTQSLEATTICSGGTCGQWASERTHFGFVYTRPGVARWGGGPEVRPIPLMIRTELPNATLPASASRAKLTAEMQNFLQGASLATFTAVAAGP